MYQTLTDYLPEIEKKATGDWTIHSEKPMPFIAYIPLVSDFEEEVYNFGEKYPEYELGQYQDILRSNGIVAGIESMQNADVTQMDGKSIMALLVCAVRAERYMQGALLDLFESGAIRKWLLRLKEIDG